MSNYNTIKSLFNDIAIKIQDKLGNHTDKIKADDFPSAIESIAGGEWLPSAETVLATFARRQSGGQGPATIEKIYGKTIVWNQLIGSSNLYGATTNNGVTFTPSNEGYTLNGTATASIELPRIYGFSQISGHKYFGQSSISAVSFNANTAGGFGGIITNSGKIINCTQTSAKQSFSVTIASGATFNGESLFLRIFDLTLMFGEGNEPSTVDEFLSLFPEALTAPYDAGSLLPVKAERIKTRGVNLWDEEWENGYYSAAGEFVSNYTQICTKNKIKVSPNTNYYFSEGSRSAGTNVGGAICFYDANRNLIRREPQNIGTFTTPSNCHYINVNFGTVYGTTYNHDICINISDSSINGQYFPYRSSDVGLPILKHFPDGLRGVGDSYDEIGPKKKVQRRAVVDLGTLNWTYTANKQVFTAYSPNNSAEVVESYGISALCAKYSKTEADTLWGGQSPDKSFVMNGGFWTSGKRIGIKDTAYTDAATFKAAMSGVELDYPLADPIVTDIDEQMTYLPDEGGMEEISPITAPFSADIRYARKLNEE